QLLTATIEADADTEAATTTFTYDVTAGLKMHQNSRYKTTIYFLCIFFKTN
ncbi:MAG: hypothetical protein GXP56_15315, partial [Deltaproteobacteria bacterium]|nr:hypothetical protein [Deltaproteobacteria bacterium]